MRRSKRDVRPSFPIVGVGASAGGLDALTQLFSALPDDLGMAFVVVQHLDPAHPSLLAEALAKVTAMAVTQAKDGDVVASNCVYVGPPNTQLTIAAGVLHLAPRTNQRRKNTLPIDAFLRSLAETHGSHSIGVILSGNASDGTDGLRAIKGSDGITFAQDPQSAKFDGMPRSAVDAGVVDYVLPIAELATELARLSHHPYIANEGSAFDPETRESVIALLRTTVGVDFSNYKVATFDRRLARRMALRNTDTLSAYLALLTAEPREATQLYEDILVHVTSFFRDAEAYDCLRTRVFPEIIKSRGEGQPIRVWVAGCSSGEEVYSMAILLLEVLGSEARECPIQIFGSDISEAIIQKARQGIFPESALEDVDDERRRRHFTKVETGYRINKNVRDLCVFVRHDLTSDPPFSKLDLVTCRNVLIYFDQALQKRVLPILHYALNPKGFLLLGRTESISGFASLFTPIDKANKVFSRTATPSVLRFAPRPEAPPMASPASRIPRGELAQRFGSLTSQLDRLLLGRYSPPGVVINERMDILQFRGETGAYLQPAPGKPQNNLMKMARPGLAVALRAAVTKARAESISVRTADVEIEPGGDLCDVVVVSVPGSADDVEPLLLVLFEQSTVSRGVKPAGAAGEDVVALLPADPTQRSRKLEIELAATRDYLQSLVDAQDQANEELNVANEELLSGNEELQSLNEELETAKEELQSTNEELITVNDELQSRNQEAAEANSDLVNLLSTVDVPILILDMKRRIRRFTPKARSIFNIVSADVGRPIEDLNLHLNVIGLDTRIAEVIASNTMHESEVQDRSGRWHRMQIRPYKTVDDKIDGATLSLVDIDTLKQLLMDAQRATLEAEKANRAKDEFLATLSHEIRTPLFSMLMHAQHLSHGDMLATSVKQAGEAIERGIMTQVKLIDDMLDVSRIVTGKFRMELKTVDLQAVIRGALESVAAPARNKEVTIEFKYEGEVARVRGDQVRLQQVVTNLLANAIKFSPAKSKVLGLVDSLPGFARIRIQDSGCGIEPDFLPHVFSRFSQEDGTTVRRHGGLGLGLAIVRHLVEAHGGVVRAESLGRNKGATFSVLLPIETEPGLGDSSIDSNGSSQVSSKGAAGNRSLEGIRIVLVDDDQETSEVVAAMLTAMGALVRVAASASQGVIAVESFRPDVLLSDIAMQGEDGYSLMRRVKGLGAARGGGDLPAIALTAFAGEEARQKSLAAGFRLHIAKPVDIERLQESVASLCARDESRRHNPKKHSEL